MTDRQSRSNRRRYLQAVGAVPLAAGLVGCSVADSLFGSLEEIYAEETADQYGLSAAGLEGAGFPAVETETLTFTVETETDDALYVFDLNAELLTYGVSGDLPFRFAVLTSPPGRESDIPDQSPLLEEWGPLEQNLVPRLMEPLGLSAGNAELGIGGGAEVTRSWLDGDYKFVGGEGEGREAWYELTHDGGDRELLMRMARRQIESSGDVVLGLLVTSQPPSEGRFSDSSFSEQRTDRLAYVADQVMPEVGSEPPTTAPDVAGGGIQDLRLVQAVTDSRVTTSPTLRLDEPDLSFGDPYSALYDLRPSTTPRTYVDVTRNDGGASGATYYFENEQLIDVQSRDSTTEIELHEMAAAGGRPDPPVWNLDQETSALRTLEVAAETPCGHTLDSEALSRGDDFAVQDAGTLMVGFIQVQDPGGGANYGRPASNGTAVTFERTVEAAVEYLGRVFPGEVLAYSHRPPMVGYRYRLGTGKWADMYDADTILRSALATNNTDGGVYTATDHSEENAEFVSRLAEEGFDVTVMIAPKGYVDHHFDKSLSGIFPGSHYMSVMALESGFGGYPRHVVDSSSTVAQEIGHYFRTQPYDRPSDHPYKTPPENWWPAAQRDDEGGDGTAPDGKVDRDHARHVDSTNYDGSDRADEPGLVSTAFDFGSGEFSLVGSYEFEDNRREMTTAGPLGPDGTQRRFESFMSYKAGGTWTDSIIYQDLLESGYTLSNYSDNGDPILAASGTVDDEGRVTLETVRALPSGRVSTETFEDAPVEVTLAAPDGEALERRAVRDTLTVEHHYQGEENWVEFRVPFPMASASVALEYDGAETVVNPITRPVRDAVDRLPDTAFAVDPETGRTRARKVLAAVDTNMRDGDYEAARAELTAYGEVQVPQDLEEDYQRFADQPSRERLVGLLERMADRLQALADYGDGSDSGEITGEVVANDVDGVAIVDHRHAVEDGDFRVYVTIENVGDQTTPIGTGQFDTTVDVYDSDGTELSEFGQETFYPDAFDLDPGERSEYRTTPELGGALAAVARYEITFTCDVFSDSPYCS